MPSPLPDDQPTGPTGSTTLRGKARSPWSKGFAALREMSPATRGRVAALVMTGGIMAVVVAASLSDRAPFLLRLARARIPLLPDVATSTTSGWGLHFFGWIAVTFFAVQVAHRWRWRLVIVGALLAFGWLIEILQGRMTQIRNYEIVDLAANLRGVAVGFTAAACYLTLRSWRATWSAQN